MNKYVRLAMSFNGFMYKRGDEERENERERTRERERERESVSINLSAHSHAIANKSTKMQTLGAMNPCCEYVM